MIKHIIVEGGDYSGKTYLINKYYKYYIDNKSRQSDILLTSEPYKTFIFNSNLDINKDIDFKYIHYLSQKRREITQKIKHTKNDNKTLYKLFLEDRELHYRILAHFYQIYKNEKNTLYIVQDRSYISTLVYQTQLNKISIDQILEDHKNIILDNIKPDFIIKLYTDIKTIAERSMSKTKNDTDVLDKMYIKNIVEINHQYDYILQEMDNNKERYFLKPSTLIIDHKN